MRKSRLAVISAVALVTLGACSSNSVAPPPATTSVAPPPRVPTTVAVTATVTVTAEFARVRLDWLVEQINRRDGDPTEAASGFAPSFLAQFPMDQIGVFAFDAAVIPV